MNLKFFRYLIHYFFLLSFAILGSQNLAFSHSGGGGDGGGGNGGDSEDSSHLASYQGSATTFVSELSAEELNALMAGLNGDVRDALLADFSTWPEGVTVRDLLFIIDSGTPASVLSEADIEELLSNLDGHTREYLLLDFDQWTADLTLLEVKQAISRWEEGDRKRANLEAYFIDKAATSVEVLDWVGEKTQTLLGFCPGIGLATSVILDTVREGANSRKDGKDTNQILEDMAVKGTTSTVLNYYSKADGLWDMAANGKNAESVLPALAAYFFTKQAEGEIGSAMEKTAHIKEKDLEKVSILGTFFRDLAYGMPAKSKNKASRPSFTSSSSGFQEGPAQHTAQ